MSQTYLTLEGLEPLLLALKMEKVNHTLRNVGIWVDSRKWEQPSDDSKKKELPALQLQGTNVLPIS